VSLKYYQIVCIEASVPVKLRDQGGGCTPQR